MSKKFSKFNYQLVESTHKGYKEVLVTFEYKGKPCHYYSFIKEKPSMNNKQYISAAKDEIQEMIKNGQLAKNAKRYLGYKVTTEATSEVVSPSKKKSRRLLNVGNITKKKGFKLFLILGLVALGVILIGGAAFIVRNYILSGYPSIHILPAEIKQITKILYYVAHGAIIVGVAGFIANLIVFIIRAKKSK